MWMGRSALAAGPSNGEKCDVFRRFAAAGAVAAALLLPTSAWATTYYVSPSGNDASSGTIASPWRTVDKVNGASLVPGDSVLFAGGARFTGLLQPPASGTASAPIVFGSYGGGRANLSGGIQLSSRSWLVFDSLAVDTGAWPTAGSTRG